MLIPDAIHQGVQGKGIMGTSSTLLVTLLGRQLDAEMAERAARRALAIVTQRCRFSASKGAASSATALAAKS